MSKMLPVVIVKEGVEFLVTGTPTTDLPIKQPMKGRNAL